MLRCHLSHALEVVICLVQNAVLEILQKKTMRGWSDDYVCCDCGYNDSKDAFGERGKNDFVKINKEREGNEKANLFIHI